MAEFPKKHSPFRPFKKPLFGLSRRILGWNVEEKHKKKLKGFLAILGDGLKSVWTKNIIRRRRRYNPACLDGAKRASVHQVLMEV
jgi:hypothetical protein